MLFDRLAALSRLLVAPSPRRRPAARRRAPAARPGVEGMEDRIALSGFLTINSPRIVEGTGGTRVVNFTVTLSGNATDTVKVNYGTSDATARAGSDYTATSGTLTFLPGQTTQTVPVTIISDSSIELTESFYLKLSSADKAMIAGATGTGSILDDDTPVASQLSVADVSMTRGLGGTKAMVFTVSLNAASTAPVTVTASTSNCTAIAGTDYQATTQVITFNPGELTKQFVVIAYGTPTATSDKVFYVNLSSASVALARATASGVIRYGA